MHAADRNLFASRHVDRHNSAIITKAPACVEDHLPDMFRAQRDAIIDGQHILMHVATAGVGAVGKLDHASLLAYE